MVRSVHAFGGALLCAAALCVASAAPSAAQVPATNDVAACSLLAEPTAQRSCRESARQTRPATAFDPSATRFRGATFHGPDAARAAVGVRRKGKTSPAAAAEEPRPQMP